jgi:hypothetical protein
MISITSNIETSAQAGATVELVTNKAAYDLDAMVSTLEELRAQRSADFKEEERVALIGRNALDKLMQRVYEVWFNAQQNGTFEALMTNVKRLLKDLGHEVRENSPKASQLIRYVFSNPSDKQVHVYGRALEAAYDRKPDRVLPADFIAFVEANDGYEGLRKQGPSSGTKGKETKRTPAVALSILQNSEKTINTLEVDWSENEDCRIFVAVLNDDGVTADLKDMLLSKENVEATLLKFYDDRESRAKPSKKKLSAADQAELARVKAQAAIKLADYSALQAELAVAKTEGTPDQVATLNAQVKSAKVQMDSVNAAVKSLTKSLKGE